MTDRAPGGSAASPPPTPFDTLAATYDRFEASALGSLLRRRVRRRLERTFTPGGSILDLGCGPGADALRLASLGVRVTGIDASGAMIEEARRRAADREGVAFHRLPLEELGTPAADAVLGAALFDGAYSSFGALNCVADAGAVGRALAGRLRPGAPVVLVVMGRWVPWEWAFFLARGRPADAFRRLGPDGAEWRGVRVRYPSPRALAGALDADFRPTGGWGLGFLLPPTYAAAPGGWFDRHPSPLRALDALERPLEGTLPARLLADHYALELVRR